MRWPFKFFRKFRTRHLRFIAEQDGPVEQEFKSRLEGVLRERRSVESAYLVQVSYAEKTPNSVALCLSAPPDSDLVRDLSKVFSALFSSKEHLDVLFLNDEKATEIARVCAPFYIRAAQID